MLIRAPWAWLTPHQGKDVIIVMLTVKYRPHAGKRNDLGTLCMCNLFHQCEGTCYGWDNALPIIRYQRHNDVIMLCVSKHLFLMYVFEKHKRSFPNTYSVSWRLPTHYLWPQGVTLGRNAELHSRSQFYTCMVIWLIHNRIWPRDYHFTVND